MVQRILVVAGGCVKTKRRLCTTVFNETLHSAVLPVFFALDVVALVDGNPRTFTALQVVREDNGEIVQKILAEGQDTGLTWDGAVKLFARLGMEEMWQRFIGGVCPSWGLLLKDGYYFGETNLLTGMLRRDHSLPEGWDGMDIGRIEQALVNNGCNLRDYVDMNVQLPYLEEIFTLFEGTRDFRSWKEAVQEAKKIRETMAAKAAETESAGAEEEDSETRSPEEREAGKDPEGE
jgi:hypothetical protein